MKRLFISRIIPLLILIIASCSKKKEEEPVPQPDPVTSEYFPLKIGNYWIYQRYDTDENGNRIYNSKTDSIYISKDTIIQGQKYYKMERENFLGNIFFPVVIADSNAYLLNYPGSPILYPDSTEIFEQEGAYYYYHSQSCRKDSAVNTPAGYFTHTITFKTYCEGNNSNNFESGYYYWVFAKDIGIIDRQVFYSSSPEKPTGITLIRYHLKQD